MGANSGVIKFLLWNLWSQSANTITASSEYNSDHIANSTKIAARNSTWRSTSKINQWLYGDLGSNRTIGAIAVVYPHVTDISQQILASRSDVASPTSSATVRVRLSLNVDLSSPVYDSGTVNVWEDFTLSGTELAQGQNSEYFDNNNGPNEVAKIYLSGMTKVFIFPAEVTGRYVQVDINDTGNSKDYLDISYIYVGRYLEPNPDLLYGWKVGRNVAARTPKASGGTMWPQYIYQRTRLSLPLAPQKESNITAYWALLGVLLGTRNEMIVQVYDPVASFRFFTTIYGRFTDTMKFTAAGFKNYNLSLQIEEIIA